MFKNSSLFHRKKGDSNYDFLEYLEKPEQMAKVMEERITLHMKRSTTTYLDLVERMVSDIAAQIIEIIKKGCALHCCQWLTMYIHLHNL